MEPHQYDVLHADSELYEDLFAPFGVSRNQFGYLMGHGTKYKAHPGTAMVKGGEQWNRVAMMLRGEATAYHHGPEHAPNERGEPSHRYVGRLCARSRPDREDLVPTRGSVIGGSALVDKGVTEHAYPLDIVAATDVEWIEWDLQELKDIIDAPRWRAVQACFYHTLYIELIGTLDKARALSIKVKDKSTSSAPAAQPTARQLWSLSWFVGVPFFGFGLADNGIMIICGDFIDAKFGTALGLTTLAAAGLGNWVSDVIGLGLGDAIERQSARMGLHNGGITRAQEKLQVTKLVTLSSKIVGISIGCFAGMIPLLFMKKKKTEFANEDLEIFDTIFGPSGVSTSQFVDLMETAKKRTAPTGEVVVKGGAMNDRVILMLRGECVAQQGDGKLKCKYVGRLEGAPANVKPVVVASRGSIIGGSAMADQSLTTTPYPRDVIAVSPIEFLEWNRADLIKLMEEEKAIQGSFFSILYGEMIATLKSDATKQRFKHYQSLLAAVVADGTIDVKERRLLDDYQVRLQISEQEHLSMLADIGWDQEAWERGSLDKQRRARPCSHPDSHLTVAETEASLEQAAALIDEVLQGLRRGLRADPV